MMLCLMMWQINWYVNFKNVNKYDIIWVLLLKVTENLLEVSHVDLVAEMMKDLVNKLKLDMEPVSKCVDSPLPKQEVMFKLFKLN